MFKSNILGKHEPANAAIWKYTLCLGPNSEDVVLQFIVVTDLSLSFEKSKLVFSERKSFLRVGLVRR